MNAEILIGCDPEFWLFSKKQDRIIPSFDIIGRGKDNPLPLKNGGMVLEDNAALECNIPPASTPKEFISNLSSTLKDIQELLGEDFDFRYYSHNKFTEEDLTHYKAFEFGCEPDFNIYLMDLNQPVEILTQDRFAGGHIHMSYRNGARNNLPENILNLGMWADIYLGLASVLLSSPSLRHKFYGKAGSIRIRNYGEDYSGIEYRYPCNFWLSSEEYQEVMAANAIKCMETWLEDPARKVPIQGIPEILNTHDKKTAEIQAKNLGVEL